MNLKEIPLWEQARQNYKHKLLSKYNQILAYNGYQDQINIPTIVHKRFSKSS